VKELNAILDMMEARAKAATPGPWWDAREFFQTKYAKRVHPTNPGPFARTWRALTGENLRRTWYVAIFGQKPDGPKVPAEPQFDPAKHDFDESDFTRPMALRWDRIKGNSVFPDAYADEDVAFIAHARTDVPRLISALREAAEAAINDGYSEQSLVNILRGEKP
jgi:hypothetical protein